MTDATATSPSYSTIANWLIACAAVSGAEDAEIARAAGITCQTVRKVIEQSQTMEEPDENAVRRSA